MEKKREEQLFERLRESELGKELVEYLSELTDYIADSRNWKNGETKESADLANRSIERKLLARIKNPGSKEKKQSNPYV